MCAVGAPEDQALNFSAPKKIDGEGTISLVDRASALGVEQFVLVSSLGTGKLGWPAGVLNLFGGVLLWKREAEKALEASGMAYTIVRPGTAGLAGLSYRLHNVDANLLCMVSCLRGAAAALCAVCCVAVKGRGWKQRSAGPRLHGPAWATEGSGSSGSGGGDGGAGIGSGRRAGAARKACRSYGVTVRDSMAGTAQGRISCRRCSHMRGWAGVANGGSCGASLRRSALRGSPTAC